MDEENSQLAVNETDEDIVLSDLPDDELVEIGRAHV